MKEKKNIMLSEREINMIRGKLSVNEVNVSEINEFLKYVDKLEDLLEDGDMEDFYGTEGWRHSLGWD